MSDTRTVHDPFLGQDVEVSDRLVDRLRGKYASGPHLPDGRPEFGWRQFEAPPIQHEAAAEIERLQAANLAALKLADERAKEAAELRAQLASSTRELADATDDLREKGK